MKKIATLVSKSFATATLLGIAATTAGVSMGSAPAQAATFSFSGNLANPNDVQFASFTVNATSPVTIASSSWANGGFDPNLTIFDAAGNWFDERDDIGINNLDFLFSEILPAGNYQVAIAAFGNNSAGFGTTSTPFNGAGDFQGLTSAYAFTITTVDPIATAVPEPMSIIGTAIAGFAAIGLKRKLTKNK